MATTSKPDKNPTCVNVLKLQRYNFKFFSLEEVVFFEYLMVKAQSFKYGPFYHATSTITAETGINRTKQDTIIKKFVSLGIIRVEIKGFPKVKYFTVDFIQIEQLLPQIYQFEEISKLDAENCKLFVDFSNFMLKPTSKRIYSTE